MGMNRGTEGTVGESSPRRVAGLKRLNRGKEFNCFQLTFPVGEWGRLIYRKSQGREKEIQIRSQH